MTDPPAADLTAINGICVPAYLWRDGGKWCITLMAGGWLGIDLLRELSSSLLVLTEETGHRGGINLVQTEEESR